MTTDTTSNLPVISTSQIPHFLKAAWDMNLADPTVQTNPALLGEPGTSKTAQVRQFADEVGAIYWPVNAAHLDLLEGKGYPIYDKDHDHVAFKRISIWPTEPGPGILFIDELPKAIPPVMSSLSQLVHGRRMGEWVLPDGWMVAFAGNRREDKAGANKIPQDMCTRLRQVNVEVDKDGFIKYIKRDGWDRSVIEFLARYSDLIHNFNPDIEVSPTLRGWEGVNVAMQTPMPLEIRDIQIAAAVGIAAAAQFATFLNAKTNIPKAGDIVRDPEGVFIPSQPSDQQHICTSLAGVVKPGNVRAYITYIKRFDGEMQEIFKQIARNRPNYGDMPELVAFCND